MMFITERDLCDIRYRYAKNHFITSVWVLFCQERVDIFDILQRVVDKELQLRNGLDLISHSSTECSTNSSGLALDKCKSLGGLLEWEDADVDFCIRQIDRYSHGCYRYERASKHRRVVVLQNFGYIALYLFCDFLLTCILHNVLKFSLKCVFEYVSVTTFLSLLFWNTRFFRCRPLFETLLAYAVTYAEAYREVVEWGAYRREPERIFAR